MIVQLNDICNRLILIATRVFNSRRKKYSRKVDTAQNKYILRTNVQAPPPCFCSEFPICLDRFFRHVLLFLALFASLNVLKKVRNMYNLLENRKLSCCCYLEGLRTIFIRGTYVNPFQSAMVNKAVKALKKKKTSP